MLESVHSVATEFDPAICWQAINARDRRFDGRFFAGVITTKVYCRPICPIPLRKPENIKWFLSAASAQAQGFRPCRRCRPHTSPGTPAWHGTVAVVARALRLIDEGALEHGNIEDLAEHVGLGARHLRRLFDEHLGVAPIQIANARRLRFARQLLNDTGLSVNQVALCAGFRSIRHFNHSIRSSFGQSPSALRKAESGSDPFKANDELCLRLPFRPPLDWPAMLRFFKEHSTSGIESVDGNCYRRTIQLGDASGLIEVAADTNHSRLVLRLRLSSAGSLMQIVDRIRRMFDLSADPRQISSQLGRDRRLRPLLAAHPGLRMPGAWDVFEIAVLAALNQRLTQGMGNVAAVRLVRAFGKPFESSIAGLTHLFPLPEALAEADLTSIGIKPTTAQTIRALAVCFRDETVKPISSKGIASLLARICAITNEATSQYIGMRACGDPDLFPDADLGVRRMLGDGCQPISRLETQRTAEKWRPWGAYAAMYLWIAAKRARRMSSASLRTRIAEC